MAKQILRKYSSRLSNAWLTPLSVQLLNHPPFKCHDFWKDAKPAFHLNRYNLVNGTLNKTSFDHQNTGFSFLFFFSFFTTLVCLVFIFLPLKQKALAFCIDFHTFVLLRSFTDYKFMLSSINVYKCKIMILKIINFNP